MSLLHHWSRKNWLEIWSSMDVSACVTWTQRAPVRFLALHFTSPSESRAGEEKVSSFVESDESKIPVRDELFARAAPTLAFKPEARLNATILQCTSGAGVPLAPRTRHSGAQQGCWAWMLNLQPVGCFIPRYKQVRWPCCMRRHVGSSHALNR